jgi:hypothetical protein
MQRARRPVLRRFVTVAALTLCIGPALAACRSEPGVAAYVGSDKITESQIDGLIANAAAAADTDNAANLKAKVESLRNSGQPTDGVTLTETELTKAPSRLQVVTAFVLQEVCGNLRETEHFADKPVTVEQVAQGQHVSARSEYAQTAAKAYGCLNGVPVTGGATPTDAEIQDIYDRAKAQGIVNVPLSQIQSQLKADSSVQQALALNRAFTKMVNDGDVSVSPRYRPIELTVSDLGTGKPLIVLTLGEPASGAVRNVT